MMQLLVENQLVFINTSLKYSKKKKNIKLANTSGYMVYGNFNCYNFHFNSYVGFSIQINVNRITTIKSTIRTAFMVDETLCLTCTRDTPSFLWEIPPLIVEVDLKVKAGFPTSNKDGFKATLANNKSTLVFVVSNGSIIRCRDGSVDDFPIISSITLIINSEFLLVKDGKSTLIFVVSKKMNQSLVVRCRDGSVDDFPIISSITLIINSEFLLVNIK